MPPINPGQEPAKGTWPSPKSLDALLGLRAQFLGFLERRVHNRAVAQDILQVAYVRMLDSAATLRDDDSAVAWFYRILRNAVIDHYRRSTRESSVLQEWARELEHNPAPDVPLEEAACGCVTAALDTLNPSYAAVLRSVEVEDTPLATYAATAGITAANAAVRVHRARGALKRKILACCGACATHGCQQCTCTQETRERMHQTG